jgi:hypothetical protein
MDRKVNNQEIRKRAAAVGIFSFAELARRIPCSRIAIYLAIERPSRFPRVVRRIEELTKC